MAKTDLVRQQSEGLASSMFTAFSVDALGDDVGAWFSDVIRASVQLGVGLAGVELDRYGPPADKMHPMVWGALADFCLSFPEDVIPTRYHQSLGYCIRVGHYVTRTGRPGYEAVLSRIRSA